MTNIRTPDGEHVLGSHGHLEPRHSLDLSVALVGLTLQRDIQVAVTVARLGVHV